MLTRGGHIFNIATKTLFSAFSVIVDVSFSLMNWAARGPFTNVKSTIKLFKHKMPNPNALPAQRARARTCEVLRGIDNECIASSATTKSGLKLVQLCRWLC